MSRTYSCVIVLFSLAIGCGEEAAESGVAAADCVQADLVEQCPPNTSPVLEADSAAVCQQDNSVDVDGAMGSGESSVSNVCVGTASCKVVCELTDPCLYGIQTISPTEGVVCFIPEGGCGDGECEVGEDPLICPQDCAAECEPNIARCTNGLLERCASNGLLEDPVPCAEGERCVDPEGEEGARCVENLCGDGTITGDEECDDGNDVNNDECTNACTLPVCGDGIVNRNEECDEGNLNSDTVADRCRTTCKSPSCGDGVRDPLRGEGCDDGNIDNGDECTSECILATCGDGILDGEEECDDGTMNSDTTPNACRTTCFLPTCGDDVRDDGEQCDHGPENGAVCLYGEMSCEVCSATCERVMGDTSYCGDNREDTMAGEQCDDANQVTEVCDYGQTNCVVCNAMCRNVAGSTAYCGDNTVDGSARTGGVAEGCDDGPDNGSNRLCKNDCTPAVCGDGLRLTEVELSSSDRYEYCDDGNSININDGCNTDCELTEKREDSTPPTPTVCEGFSASGRGCSLSSPRLVDGECLFEQCFYTNPLPLVRPGAARTENRQGLIHGVLTYNSSLPAANRRDLDVFGFEQLCGYGSLQQDRGSDCVGENSAVYYFTVDYTGGDTSVPFYVQQDCNGVVGGDTGQCATNIATFCTSDSRKEVCLNKPQGKNRAYWCSEAGVVGDYRVWLGLDSTTTSTVSYTLTVTERIGATRCLYLEQNRPRL